MNSYDNNSQLNYIVSDIKAKVFDVIANGEKTLLELKKYIETEEDEDRKEELLSSYKEYDSLLKRAIAQADSFTNTIETLDSYSYLSDSFEDETDKEGTYLDKDTKEDNEESVLLSNGEDDVLAEDQENEVVRDEEPLQVEEQSQDKVVENKPLVVDNTISDVDSSEDAVVDDSSDSLGEDNNEPLVDDTIATDLEESTKPIEESNTKEESENTTELNDATTTDKKVDVGNNVNLPTDLKESIKPVEESNTKEEGENTTEDVVANVPLIPITETEPSQQQVTPDESAIISLSSLTDEVPDKVEASNDISYERAEGEDKAILITEGQASKLRASLSTEEALLKNNSNSNSTENGQSVDTTNNQSDSQSLEEMMEEIPKLYSEGKVEEAEKLSEKVRVLNNSSPSVAA